MEDDYPKQTAKALFHAAKKHNVPLDYAVDAFVEELWAAAERLYIDYRVEQRLKKGGDI